MEKMITRILLICSLIGVPFGVYFFFEDKYAKASDIIQINQSIQSIQKSIEYDHLNKQREDKQNRVWSLTDRYKDTNKAPQAVKEELRKLQKDLEDLDAKLKGK